MSSDTPAVGTFRRYLWETSVNFAWARARWGSRLLTAVAGLMADALTETAQQTFYARLPGHPHQAPDSLDQSGSDRDLFRFRGESLTAFAARVFGSWDDYAQGGTSIQVLKVVNQWGAAGWPVSWDDSLVTLVESGDPDDWSFTLTIGYGAIVPPLASWEVGPDHVVGESTLFIGVAHGYDFIVLLYLIRKWKRSASVGYVKIYYSVSDFVIFTVR